MGLSELLSRCVRISCARLFECVKDALVGMRRRLSGSKGHQYERVQEGDEEDLGLLTEPDLGMEDAVILQDDAELFVKAKEIVEQKAAKKLGKKGKKLVDQS